METTEECVQKVKQVSFSHLGMAHLLTLNFMQFTVRESPILTIRSFFYIRRASPEIDIGAFCLSHDSESIWFKRKELLKIPRLSTVLLDKDLLSESARERAKLRAAYKKAKDLNMQ